MNISIEALRVRRLKS